MKKAITLGAMLFLGAAVFANTVIFKAGNYDGSTTYNEEVLVGDAVFARVAITKPAGKKKTPPQFKGVLQLICGEKKTDSARFYQINSNAQNQVQYLCAIPVTIWASPEKTYSLKMIFTVSGEGTTEEKTVTLPLSIVEKKFPSEVLDLNESNSNIKQDMSSERYAQINKLNKILGTVTPEDTFTLKPFVRPVKSERMTAHFGDRRVYKYTNGKSESSSHYGHDYGVPEKTEVFACGDGKVVMAESRISTGWSVVIEHLPGLYSLYYHMSELKVKEGDTVKQGSLIGLSGSTGLATGPHLHWEVRLNMAAVCPDFFTKDFTYEKTE